ncbi:MAG: metallophosphoesterase family protein [Candidatus Limnocylindria bacterium]
MSRIALLSDVHASLPALEAVLAAAGRVDAIWVMGDTAGYGPDPSDVLALLGERRALMVAGNHDLAVGTGQGLEAFNEHAGRAARIHRGWLSPAERDALASLPLTRETDGFTLCHGSLRDPVWEYVFTAQQARATIELAITPHCCNGHTHVPAVYKTDEVRTVQVPFREDEPVRVEARMLVNPGSVGQPRDGDPRAAYAILDTDEGTVVLARAAYDVAETQRRIRSRGLPGILADRLAVGY